MPRTPFQSQSRYEGGRRPWNLAAEPVKKARGSPYKYKEKPEEIQACLSCPLPDCRPQSPACPVRHAGKAPPEAEGREEGHGAAGCLCQARDGPHQQ